MLYEVITPGMPDWVTYNEPEKAINFWLGSMYGHHQDKNGRGGCGTGWHASPIPGVITSYSIHYTKLYDVKDAIDTETVGGVQISFSF